MRAASALGAPGQGRTALGPPHPATGWSVAGRGVIVATSPGGVCGSPAAEPGRTQDRSPPPGGSAAPAASPAAAASQCLMAMAGKRWRESRRRSAPWPSFCHGPSRRRPCDQRGGRDSGGGSPRHRRRGVHHAVPEHLGWRRHQHRGLQELPAEARTAPGVLRGQKNKPRRESRRQPGRPTPVREMVMVCDTGLGRPEAEPVRHQRVRCPLFTRLDQEVCVARLGYLKNGWRSASAQQATLRSTGRMPGSRAGHHGVTAPIRRLMAFGSGPACAVPAGTPAT
jgi:hypothetical protein